ncbi:MAG: YqgE/AlgH family protein [Verrucomicrobiales bacterium]
MTGDFKSLKGQFLLDSGQLRGSMFHRSVVLICQHDSEGAFGLVLTQPMESKVGDMLVADIPESLQEESLFAGGPVQPSALSYLYSDNSLLNVEGAVLPNLYLGHSLDELVDLAEKQPKKQIRCFAGYSGWTAGQLDNEVKRKAWLIHPASIAAVFHSDPVNMWKRILAKKGWEYKLLADSPEDPSWN